jgi:hypothetical protein
MSSRRSSISSVMPEVLVTKATGKDDEPFANQPGVHAIKLFSFITDDKA